MMLKKLQVVEIHINENNNIHMHSDTINTVAADDLATPWTRASATMLLELLCQEYSTLALEEFDKSWTELFFHTRHERLSPTQPYNCRARYYPETKWKMAGYEHDEFMKHMFLICCSKPGLYSGEENRLLSLLDKLK